MKHISVVVWCTPASLSHLSRTLSRTVWTVKNRKKRRADTAAIKKLKKKKKLTVNTEHFQVQAWAAKTDAESFFRAYFWKIFVSVNPQTLFCVAWFLNYGLSRVLWFWVCYTHRVCSARWNVTSSVLCQTFLFQITSTLQYKLLVLGRPVDVCVAFIIHLYISCPCLCHPSDKERFREWKEYWT